MKKIFLIFSMVFFGIQGYAQKITPSLDGQYYDFVKSSMEFYGSSDYNNSELLSDEFVNKVVLSSYRAVCTVEDFEVWIKEHLSETKFTSVEEAVKLFEENRKASEKIREKRRTLFAQESAFAEKYGEDFMENYSIMMAIISVSKKEELKKGIAELKKGVYTALNN